MTHIVVPLKKKKKREIGCNIGDRQYKERRYFTQPEKNMTKKKVLS